MPKVELKLTKDLFAPKFYPLLLDYSNRFECHYGGSGSGKSYFVTEKLIIRALNEPIRILVCRRYGSTLRQTCFSLFKDILRKWKLTPYVKINESEMRITFLNNGSEIIFIGLDDECKLLSLNNIGSIFVEEAYEVPLSIIEQLNLRMRGKNVNQQIIMCWNPISKSSYLYNFVNNPPKSCLITKSTFRDNPFLPKEYIDALMDLYRTNPQKARVFNDAEWGINPDGLVYTNWTTDKLDRMELCRTYEKRFGVDLGMTDPTAIIESYYDRENRIIYVTQEFCKTGQTIDEIYNALIKMSVEKCVIYFDFNEPRVIQAMRNKGINAKPALKGAGSVQARIMFLQNHRIIVDKRCVKTIEALENYSYVKSKQTGEYTDDTEHQYSHIPDSLGYSYSDIYTQGKIKTLSKESLSIW